jgi:hypothetical protein
MQSHTSGIAERPDGKLERILLELEKMAQLVKQPSKKPAPDYRLFIEALIKWVAMKLIYFCMINHLSFSEMIQGTNPDSSVLTYNILGPHIKRLAEVHQQFPEG